MYDVLCEFLQALPEKSTWIRSFMIAYWHREYSSMDCLCQFRHKSVVLQVPAES